MLACILVWPYLGSHIAESSWVQHPGHAQETLFCSSSISPLASTVFLPSLLKCFLSLDWRSYAIDIYF